MIPVRDSVFCRTPPYAVVTLIVMNAVVFLFMLGLDPRAANRFIAEYALIPILYTPPPGVYLPPLGLVDYLRPITSTFLHGGWLHILLNMWTLWLFGCALESRLGTGRFVAFYLACGLAAGVVHVLFNAGSQVPTLGASGAVAGVIAAYAWSYPRAEIKVLVPIIIFPLFFDIPAMGFALFWFGLQLLQGYGAMMAPEMGAGIAWWAHAGGFVAGVGLLYLLAPENRRPMPWDHIGRR